MRHDFSESIRLTEELIETLKFIAEAMLSRPTRQQ